jgi:TPR repeat protein
MPSSILVKCTQVAEVCHGATSRPRSGINAQPTGGYASAQYNLGRRYALGQGVPQNYVLGYKWFNLAAAQGIQEAVKWRDTIVQHMTSAQIAEAQNLARDWTSKRER